MILYAAADLIWASKIKGTAEALGLLARPARNREMLAARLADSPVKALLVDLSMGEEALKLLREARGLSVGNHLRLMAWGPHVAKDLLQAARDAGADEVMTNGAMEHNLEDVLLRLDS
jgi:hypothetical protein